jgi:hypothetical protein
MIQDERYSGMKDPTRLAERIIVSAVRVKWLEPLQYDGRKELEERQPNVGVMRIDHLSSSVYELLYEKRDNDIHPKSSVNESELFVKLRLGQFLSSTDRP